CRIEGGRDPVRIVVDSKLVTPIDSKLVKTAKDIRTIICTASDDGDLIKQYESHDVEIFKCSLKEGHIDLKDMLEKLGADGIDSIYVEGGAGLHSAMLKDRLYNKAEIYISPKIFGGVNAKTPVGGEGVDDPIDAFDIRNVNVTRIGDDFLFEGDF
ncbi:MAG: RibD family protein, partial [Lachnospiraceae bacterium]|nr:RibD family protein [Lachnospiraceae bacterium]